MSGVSGEGADFCNGKDFLQCEGPNFASCMVMILFVGAMLYKRYRMNKQFRHIEDQHVLDQKDYANRLVKALPQVKGSVQTVECSICIQGSGEFCMLPCQHCFHRTCLGDWFQTLCSRADQSKLFCPVCRQEVTSDLSPLPHRPVEDGTIARDLEAPLLQA